MVGGKYHAPSRNYLGMLGTLLAFWGIFLPCIKIWGFSLSLVDALSELHDLLGSTSYLDSMMGTSNNYNGEIKFLLFVIIILLIIAFVLFFCNHDAAQWIGVGLLGGLLIFSICAQGETDNDIVGGFFSYVTYGYWIMILGLILMIAAPALSGPNQAIENRFSGSHTYQSPRPRTPVSQAPQWTCKRCGRKNTGNGNFCSGCGQQNPSKLFCPSCGKPVAVGDVFCMHCQANLAEAKQNAAPAEPPKPKEEVAAAPDPVEPLKEEEKLPYEGVWQSDVNDKGIPREELVISRLQEKLFRFELTQNGVYSIHGQMSTLNSQGTSFFQTEDSAVTGMLSFEESRALLIVDTANFPYLDTGDVLIFPIHSDRRAL